MDKFVSDLKLILFLTVYSFGKINNQLDTLNRLITHSLDKHTLLKKVEFIRPVALWMKDLVIVELQQKQKDMRYKAHKSQTTYDLENFRQIRNKFKQKIKRNQKELLQKGFVIKRHRRHLENNSSYFQTE